MNKSTTLTSETINRVKDVIANAKRNNFPVQAIKALEASLARIQSGSADSSDHGRIARVLGLNK